MDYVGDMGQSELAKLAVTEDAPTKLGKEESALGMGGNKFPRPDVMKDTPTMLVKKEGSTSGMGQSELAKLAVTKDAPTKHEMEEYVGGMG